MKNIVDFLFIWAVLAAGGSIVAYIPMQDTGMASFLMMLALFIMSVAIFLQIYKDGK